MNLSTQKRMASQILGVGYNRVLFDEDELEEIAAAVTREDIKRLINKGAISARQVKGTSRGRIKRNMRQKAKGRRSGHGSRKGSKNAKVSSKKRWIKTIRPIRKRLKELREEGAVDRSVYRKTYRMAKGGIFRSKAYLESYLKEHKMMR
ncbi:MAG: 50S ribosomal protein L19e [Methanobacteriota archaeon]|nr:MAG: 50S ribosomal protein L19e [Euryarchaeota archaeon]